jgi:hypothetical protein
VGVVGAGVVGAGLVGAGVVGAGVVGEVVVVLVVDGSVIGTSNGVVIGAFKVVTIGWH